MNQEHFFSVIIPTYNRAALVMNAIRSVLQQRFADWEVIVVDDGSTDNTRDMVTALQDPRVKYIYQDHAERSAARNNGISHAQGKFICFLDSDDVYLPHHLESLHELILENKGIEGMYVTHVIRNEFGKIVNVPFEKAENFENAVCYLLNTRESIIPARVCINKTILNDFRFDESLRNVEDTVLWVQIVSRYPLFQTPEQTSVYLIHETNSSAPVNNPFINQLEGLRKIFTDPSISKMIPRSLMNQRLSLCYYRIAEFYFGKGNYSQMATHLIRSICFNPLSSSTKNKLYMMGAGLAYASGLKG